MSTQQMSAEESVLYQQVYLPAYIQKCAERGIQFADEGDLTAALESTALAKMAMARSQGSQIKQANANLKKLLGVDVAEQQAQAEQSIKTAAQRLNSSADVKAAALKSLKR